MSTQVREGRRAELNSLIRQLVEAGIKQEAEEAIDLLVDYDEEALWAVHRHIDELSLPSQRAILRLIEYHGGDAGLALLEKLWREGSLELEEQVIQLIGELRHPDGLRLLLECLAQNKEELFIDLFRSLEKLFSEHPIILLRRPLRTVSEEILSASIEILETEQPERLDSLLYESKLELYRQKLSPFGTVRLPGEKRTKHVHFRTRTLKAIEERLAGKGNRSFLLVGPSGVGKSTVMEELCLKLGPEGSADIMLMTSSGFLLAGTRYLGEWQTRLRNLIEALRQNPRILVHVSDVNNLLGAGSTHTNTQNIADFIAPHIEKGDLVLIGESTSEAIRRYIAQRPDFKSLFYIIQLDEPLRETTRRIAVEVGRELAQNTFEQEGFPLHFNEVFFSRLLEIADQFHSTTARPGRAIRLLKQTAKRVTREHVLQGRTDEITLGSHHIIETLVESSGIPKKLLDDRDPLDIDEVRQFFTERVLGQEDAVDVVIDLITLIKAGLTDPSKPTGVLFFVGPTGVGKTELAKALAEYIFGSSERMIRLDMSEYKEYGSIERLIGSPHAPEWSPHRQGLLTGRIREEPFSVILLDEFEKAHQSLFDIFLQVMDDGRLTDADGRVAHFTQSILIMTSNVGGAELVSRGIGFQTHSQIRAADHVRRQLEKYFRPEFINRIDRIVPFLPLELEDMQKIVSREIGKVLMRSGIKRRNLIIDTDPSLLELLVQRGFDSQYGARPLKREVERRILQPLARTIIQLGDRAERALLQIFAEDNQVRIDVIRSDSNLNEQESQTEPQIAPRKKQDRKRLKAQELVLQEQISRLETLIKDEGLIDKKTLLIQRSGQPSFWDDTNQAKLVLSEIHWIEQLLEGLDRTKTRAEDMARVFEQKQSHNDADLAKFFRQIKSIQKESSLLELALCCKQEEDRTDTFVTIERLDSLKFDSDPILQLLKMYEAWSRHHRFELKVLNEHAKEGRLQTATILIKGLCAYGILSAEEGIHRLIHREQNNKNLSPDEKYKEKTTAFCRVSVLPYIENPEKRFSKSELQVQSKPTEGKGFLVQSYISSVRLHHKASDIIVYAKNDLKINFLRPLATAYLQSLLANQNKPAPSVEDGTTPIRTYNLGSRTTVKDERTNIRKLRSSDVFSGEIDSFLKARLDLRLGN